MTLQLLLYEFPYIQGKYNFLFYQCNANRFWPGQRFKKAQAAKFVKKVRCRGRDQEEGKSS
jgi:hypothetical protein